MTDNEKTPDEILATARPRVLATIEDALKQKFGAEFVHVLTDKNKIILQRYRTDEIYIIEVKRTRRR